MYLSLSDTASNTSGGTRKFSASTDLGVWVNHSLNRNVESSSKSPLSKTSRNSVPFGDKPWSECGWPEGKYQRSPFSRSSTNEPPSVSRAVIRTLPIVVHHQLRLRCRALCGTYLLGRMPIRLPYANAVLEWRPHPTAYSLQRSLWTPLALVLSSALSSLPPRCGYVNPQSSCRLNQLTTFNKLDPWLQFIPSQIWQISMISTRWTYQIGILTLTVLIAWPHHIVTTAIALHRLVQFSDEAVGFCHPFPRPTIGSGWIPSPKVSCFRSYGSLYPRSYGLLTTRCPTGFWSTGAEIHAVNSKAVEAKMAELCITALLECGAVSQHRRTSTTMNIYLSAQPVRTDFPYRFDPPSVHGSTVSRRNLSGAQFRPFLAGLMPFRWSSYQMMLLMWLAINATRSTRDPRRETELLWEEVRINGCFCCLKTPQHPHCPV